MNLLIERYKISGNVTLGKLYINGHFECYTVEDLIRKKKIKHETAIPEGVYCVGLRTEGGFHKRYKAKFDFHKGMLCIFNREKWIVENNGMSFQYCYFHIGNYAKDTSGCILVCQDVANGMGKRSTAAYKIFYPKVLKAAQREPVILEIKNLIK